MSEQEQIVSVQYPFNNECIKSGLDVRRIKSYILKSLGEGIIQVELKDAHLNTSIQEALEQLQTYYGGTEKYGAFVVSPGSDSYQIGNEVFYITEVNFSPSTLNLPAGAEHFFIPELQFYNNSLNLVQYYQFLDWISTANRLLGLEQRWELLSGNVIRISPRPNHIGLAVYRYIARYDLGGDVGDNTEFENTVGKNMPGSEPFMEFWIKRYALAHAKSILGEVRSKYGTIAAGNESITLNGEALKAESKEEKESLKIELHDFDAGAGHFFMG